jgi:DUF4097 and DUF4098 domain-containing protein YvlB
MKSRALIANGAILAFVGTSCAALLLSLGPVEEQFHQSYPLASGGRVSLDNINGNVKVTAWDRDEVRVDAVKRASSRDRLDEARIVVDSSPDAIRIQTRYADSNLENDAAYVEYRLNIPRQAQVDEIRLVNGSLGVDGLSGDVRASTVNGSIKASNLTGDAKISTVNGRVEANFNRLGEASSIYLNSVNGNIEVSLPHDAHADFTANNVTGNINNDFGFPVERGPFIGSKLKASWKGGGTRIKVRNVNGNILIVPVVNGRRIRLT